MFQVEPVLQAGLGEGDDPLPFKEGAQEEAYRDL